MSSNGGEKLQKSWYIYGHDKPKEQLQKVLDRNPPSWRDFANEGRRSAYKFQIGRGAVEVVNAAIYLRRPLLVTGDPGTGKSSFAYSIASQLGLGSVIEWPITSRSVLHDALYRYDAIGRLQAANLAHGNGDPQEAVPIEQFLTLGPLGTALADSSEKPRVLLIDEIDKSDIDLPNDLLFLFEEGKFEIPELVRLTGHRSSKEADESGPTQRTFSIRKHNAPVGADSDAENVDIVNGMVTCVHFPIVIMTSNGEREMPAPFLRRCLNLEMNRPDRETLENIVAAHFDDKIIPEVRDFIEHILDMRRQNKLVATDQLMNAVFMAQQIVLENRGETEKKNLSKTEIEMIQEIVLQAISRTN